MAIGDRSSPDGLDDQVGEALASPLLREGLQLVDVLARHGHAGNGEPAHDAARLDRRAEDAELRAAHGLADVADLEPVAQVRLVRAVAAHHLGVRQPRERQLELDAGDLLPDLGVQPLAERQHVLALDEAHLDVELGELELAVGALRLVPEAAGDLVVAVVARRP